MLPRNALFCALLACAFPVFGQANTIPAARHLVVKGHAQRDVLPDRFTIRMTVETVDRQPDLARARVQTHIADLLKAMKSSHVMQDEVTATALSIKPKTTYKNDEEVFKGTEVSRNLRATFARPQDLQMFLTQVQTSEEVQIDGIETFLSNRNAVEAELRAEAIATTRHKADEMANAYGARVSGLYAVSDVAPRFDYGIVAYEDSRGDASTLDRIVVTGSRISPEQLEVGTVTLESDVYAVFLLAD